MKKLLLRTLAIFLFICLSSFEIALDASPYTKTQIESFVREVFANQADQLVMESTSGRLQLIESFLERFHISQQPQYAGKKFRLLSSVSLCNKYNPNLIRDVIVNPTTFNPLKYNFPMTSKAKEIFRVDHTDILIVIEPVK